MTLHPVVACVLLAAASAALSQTSPLPPRSTADVLAVLEEHKPDGAKMERLKKIVSAPPPQTRDRIDLRNFHRERGRAAGVLGMVELQVADLKKVLEYTPPDDGSRNLYRTELAVAEIQAGDFIAAVESFERAVHEAPNNGARLSAWASLTSVRAQLGDLPAARKALEKVDFYLAQLLPTRGAAIWSDVWRALALRAHAQVKRFEGRFPEAEIDNATVRVLWDRAIASVPLQRQHSDVTVEQRVQVMILWQIHNHLPVLLEQGKFAEAELLARDALKRALKTFGRYSLEAGWALTGLAAALFEQGRFGEAQTMARVAEETYVRLGAAPYSHVLNEARRVRGEALMEEGRHAEALEVLTRRRQGLGDNPSGTEKLQLVTPAWIDALLRTGRTADALADAKAYHEDLAERFGPQLYATLEAAGYYALALAADGKLDDAAREFQAAIPALLDAAAERTGEEGFGRARTRRLSRILESYVALLGRYAAQGRSPEGVDAAAEAFRIADVARGSSVQRALSAASARAAIRDPELARLAREEQDAAQRVGSLTGILVELLSRPADKRPEAIIERMRADIGELRKRRKALRADIAKRFPDYAELINPSPADLAAARARLQQGEALIALYGTEAQTFVWAVSADGATGFHAAALGRRERDELVVRLRKALDVGEASLHAFPQFDVAAAHRLYGALLAPVAKTWDGAKNLLVVPHGSLAQLPFALLVTEPTEVAGADTLFEGYRNVPWLLRRAAVTQLPSVNTIVSLRSTVRARAPQRQFAGFGDPIFTKDQKTTATKIASRGLGLRTLKIDKVAAAPALAIGDTAPAVANSSRLEQLSPLPDTALEIREIAQALKAEAGDVFLGPQASERNVRRAKLDDRRIVAFATHGLVPGDLDGLTQPALALSNPAVTGNQDEDGLLSMEEVLALRLNADWVVLSACNTASGEGAGSEAVSGLGKAFFYAGARAILVSNWPVETVSARLLTTDVFRRQVANPALSRAEALRESMLELLDRGVASDSIGKPVYAYAHPMFWAPFTLVGDPGSQ